MKKLVTTVIAASVVVFFLACTGEVKPESGTIVNPETPETPETPESPSDPDTSTTGSNILVAYFSWSGNTETVAKRIADLTGADIYEIEPATPYTTDYQTLAYTVARQELDNNARPELKDKNANIAAYDYIFIGCPVWWGEAPMIMHSFGESYDFSGKTVIPFCTYATSRGTTIDKLNELTSGATHLSGFWTSGRNTNGLEDWLKTINMIK